MFVSAAWGRTIFLHWGAAYSFWCITTGNVRFYFVKIGDARFYVVKIQHEIVRIIFCFYSCLILLHGLLMLYVFNLVGYSVIGFLSLYL